MNKIVEHKCKEAEKCSALYNTYFLMPESAGSAINGIFIDQTRRLAYCTNGEYSTIIKFCPFCGARLIKWPFKIRL